MALPRAAEVVIVGAGALGCSIAYQLTRRGMRDVVVVEREAIGSGSTSKAAGGIRVQFGLKVEVEFSLRGIAFFKRFDDEMGVPCDFRQEGYLFLVTDEADLARFRRNVALQTSLGADVRIIAPDDARAMVPGLRTDDVIAAVWGPMDGYASPNDVVQAYASRARAGGAKIVEGTPVTGLARTGDRVTGVLTPEGPIEARVVVNAAGPQAPLVGRMAGVEVPVDPRRRHIFVTGQFDGVRHPMPLVTDRGSGFYCRSEQGAVLMSAGDIGGTTEYTASVDWGMLEPTVRKAVRRLPALEHAEIHHAWAGLRPLTPDDHGILDWAPGVEGLFLAAGFCGHGFQHSFAAGEEVADLLTTGKSGTDISDLSLARFAKKAS
ncbi:MAG: FAD-binding oxidoreductase [Candidatus Rokubacteria bacterium]|nr:FAD-binding oxidoreductase [Candidatus Rokubacteria bacterium]MBI3827673.1 FAD-binding oxidoreductase [Candidatus Rokubacteria bacterium]